MTLSRRSFLGGMPAAAFVPSVWQSPAPGGPAGATVHPAFPTHDPAMVKEMVGVAHGNVARVRELLASHPALAKAGWDWGFGDWETALSAASHVGNREIAQLLLDHGARPTLFSAAMLGQLDVVRAFVVEGLAKLPAQVGEVRLPAGDLLRPAHDIVEMRAFLADQPLEHRDQLRRVLAAHPLGELRISRNGLLLHRESDRQQLFHRFDRRERLGFQKRHWRASRSALAEDHTRGASDLR